MEKYQNNEKMPERENAQEGILKIYIHGIPHCEKDGVSALVEPWFDIDGKLPFDIPQDVDTSDVFFYALYNPDGGGSMKYICVVEDSESKRMHEFSLTEFEMLLLKEGIEEICRVENDCDLATYWNMRQ